MKHPHPQPGNSFSCGQRKQLKCVLLYLHTSHGVKMRPSLASPGIGRYDSIYQGGAQWPTEP